jgi:hypothetical protein
MSDGYLYCIDCGDELHPGTEEFCERCAEGPYCLACVEEHEAGNEC